MVLDTQASAKGILLLTNTQGIDQGRQSAAAARGSALRGHARTCCRRGVAVSGRLCTQKRGDLVIRGQEGAGRSKPRAKSRRFDQGLTRFQVCWRRRKHADGLLLKVIDGKRQAGTSRCVQALQDRGVVSRSRSSGSSKVSQGARWSCAPRGEGYCSAAPQHWPPSSGRVHARGHCGCWESGEPAASAAAKASSCTSYLLRRCAASSSRATHS